MATAKIKFQNPHPAQEKILKSKAKRVVVNTGRQFGKTSLMLRICIEHMLTAKFPNGKLPSVIYTTPTASLGIDVFKEFLSYIPDDFIEESNQTRMFVKFQGGATFRILTSESGGIVFRGKRARLLVLDEYAHYKNGKNLYLASIEPTVLSYGDKA